MGSPFWSGEGGLRVIRRRLDPLYAPAVQEVFGRTLLAASLEVAHTYSRDTNLDCGPASARVPVLHVPLSLANNATVFDALFC